MKKILAILAILLFPAYAGATTWFECSGTSFCGASYSNYWGTVSLNSTDGSWRWTFPAGMPGGEGVANVWTGGFVPSGQTEMWLQWQFKYSSGFVYNGITNKQLYFYPSNTMGMGIVPDWGVNMQPQGPNQTNYPPNVNSSLWYVTQTGTWHTYKARFVLNSGSQWNGIYQAWVDDVMVSNYSNAYFADGSTTFSDVNFVVIYGGASGDVPQTQYLDIKNIYMGSTDPGSSSGGDTTGPYFTNFSPSNGATGVLKTTTQFSFTFGDSGTGATGVNISTLSGTCGSTTKTCSTGLICSTVSGTYTVTWGSLSLDYEDVLSCSIQGADIAGNWSYVDYGFTVEDAPAAPVLAITTTSIASGKVGEVYSASLSSTGGTSPYTYAVTSGSLPAGIYLSSSGSFSGTPTTAGSETFTVTVTDAVSATDGQELTLTIAPATGGTTTTQSTDFADTFINSGSADANYYSDSYLRVYQWPASTVANRILIMDNADIVALPDNVVINSATLYLYMLEVEGSGGTNPMRVYAYQSTSFDTSVATWNTWGSTLSTAESYANVSTTPGWYSWTVTQAVAWAYANGEPLYIALDGRYDGAQDTNRVFASKDYATSALRPYLSITYTQLDTGGVSIPAPGKFRAKGKFHFR